MLGVRLLAAKLVPPIEININVKLFAYIFYGVNVFGEAWVIIN